MRIRFALLLFCMMLGATVANAQFNAFLINESQPIMSACVGGTPVPDGTTVQIFWDSLGNGVTPDDHQPVEGPGFMEVNFNQFGLNGAEVLEVPGGFGTDPAFSMTDGIPDPANNTGYPLYWLRVCLDGNGIYWQSDTFRVIIGVNEIFFGEGEGQVPFTCVTGVCGGCASPSPVFNLTATQDLCDSIVVDWEHDLVNIHGYRVLIDGELPYHYISGGANSRYVDFTSIGGQDHTYGVRAYRVCAPGDTGWSVRETITGRKRVGPPTPTWMAASDAQCSRVEVRWVVNTILGVDSFRVYRAGTLIGSRFRTAAGDTMNFFDNAPLGGVTNYCVAGFSIVCNDTGTAVCDNGAAGSVPACDITNVSATGDRCDSVVVTWDYACTDADSFRIIRSLTNIATVPGTARRFAHQPPAGLVGAYQVQAVNACGQGTAFPQPTGDPGQRLSGPGQVAGIAASDTLCDSVRVVWNTMANIDSFQIRRDGNRIGMVLGSANPLVYVDNTAVAGTTYTYTVVAYNQCGPGAVAAGNQGTRRAPGTGTATFALVTPGPPNWTYSMTVTSGCMNTVTIRDFCTGTTATPPTGWTVASTDTTIIFSTTNAAGAGETVTGFGLSHPTCDGNGRWNIGQSGGSIRGPLPIGDNAMLPTEYSVKVFPNPFNPMTNFKIALPQAADARVLVFNIMGQVVRDMNLGKLQAGYHQVQFGGSDLPSGMYFARVVAGQFSSTHKLMLLK